jgi:LemA protein
MTTTLIVIGIILLLLVAWAVSTYNGLVKLRNKVEESWRQIDVELKRRHDLIGNLVETVKGYAAHERGTLEDVMKARSAAMAPGQSPAAQAQSEGMLTQALGRLIAVAEAYPDLKANQNFTALQDELTSTEDRIASARRYYNANVREMNTKVESVPSNVIAGMFNFARAEYFEVEGEERDPVKVDFGQRESTIPPPSSYAGSDAPEARAPEQVAPAPQPQDPTLGAPPSQPGTQPAQPPQYPQNPPPPQA